MFRIDALALAERCIGVAPSIPPEGRHAPTSSHAADRETHVPDERPTCECIYERRGICLGDLPTTADGRRAFLSDGLRRMSGHNAFTGPLEGADADQSGRPAGHMGRPCAESFTAWVVRDDPGSSSGL